MLFLIRKTKSVAKFEQLTKEVFTNQMIKGIAYRAKTQSQS